MMRNMPNEGASHFMGKLSSSTSKTAQSGFIFRNHRATHPGAQYKLLISILLAALLSSCANIPGIGPTPTPVIFEADEESEVQFEPLLTPSPEPFRFNLPTPGAEPISAWRPPLYPIPWAMSPYDHFYFARPIAADQVNWPNASYRYGGVFLRDIVHTGVDIPTPEGTPILAAGPGTVVWAGWGLFRETPGDQTDPYGLAIAIRHDFGYRDQQLYTIYAHMSEMIAVRGQRVETGDVIGLVGQTGAATGPHVHFEVRLPNNSFFYTYNPELWIAPPQGWGVLVGRVMDEKGELLQQVEVTVRSEELNRTFVVRTYGKEGAINPDPYYNENMVLGDLPAGIYKVSIRYKEEKRDRETWVEIFPGQTSYFTFKGETGYSSERPPAPELDFIPTTPTAEIPATP